MLHLVEEWDLDAFIEEGVVALQLYLARHLAFTRFLEADGRA